MVWNAQPGNPHKAHKMHPLIQVIKGNWQLSGGHKGSSSDDRTAGKKAVEDIDKFVAAGVTTMDTADIYGPSEKLIGDYIRGRPQGREGLELLTKFCRFGNDQVTVSQKSVTSVRAHRQPHLHRFFFPAHLSTAASSPLLPCHRSLLPAALRMPSLAQLPPTYLSLDKHNFTNPWPANTPGQSHRTRQHPLLRCSRPAARGRAPQYLHTHHPRIALVPDGSCPEPPCLQQRPLSSLHPACTRVRL